MNVLQWAPLAVAKLSTLLTIADAALDAAKAYAVGEQAAVRRLLAIEAGLLVLAILVAWRAVRIVARRVIQPLQAVSGAMARLAQGNLDADAKVASRTDKIGALAAAFAAFRQNAVEKARIEGEQRTRHTEAAARQAAIERHVTRLDSETRAALTTIGAAQGEMEGTSRLLRSTAEQANAQAARAA
jgi:methyl-accepting chemotaxis protein